MPRSIAPSTTGRSARDPARCPSATETPCSVAQRPLPSMMIATACATSGRCSSGLTSVPVPGTEANRLDLHHFGLFVLEQLVDLLRVLVRQLLHAALGPMLVVGADLSGVDELLEVLHGVSPDLAHRDSVALGHVADDLHELLPPLLRELGNRQADQLAVVRRRQPEIRLLDRLLDRLDRARV